MMGHLNIESSKSFDVKKHQHSHLDHKMKESVVPATPGSFFGGSRNKMMKNEDEKSCRASLNQNAFIG